MKDKKVSIIIPTLNEVNSVKPLLERIFASMREIKCSYEIIFVDDNSNDGTFEKIQQISNQLNTDTQKLIKLYRKEGKRGKAFSLFEGFRKATGDIYVMIDGDLQYPPEAIPVMINRLNTADIVVANRKNYEEGKLRWLSSRTFEFIFGKLLFGLDSDIQSGLKAISRDVVSLINFRPTSEWTFDAEFLFRAKQAGFRIGNVDIVFSKRRSGNSKVKFIKTVFEIGFNALNVRIKKVNPIIIPSLKPGSMLGAGIGYNQKKLITHTTLHSSKSALFTFIPWQIFLIADIALIIAIGLLLSFTATIIAIVATLSVIYFIDVLFNLYIILKSLYFPPELKIKPKEVKDLNDDHLPIYSILCPLYHEAGVLPRYLNSIRRLDWPKDKLDVILLLEEDDHETINMAKSLNPPPYIHLDIVPNSLPKTKPKACNFGLNKAKGDYLVIFDAEDRPEPEQLKKAYLGFQKASKKVICLQAKLNYFNPQQNLLTKLFTAEYSLWFDVILTGLQSINTTIPLGGTSNHFKTADIRRLQGWDPFNVTEDCDLGVRIFKNGYNTAVIDSTTWEEANSNIKNWLRQRSRWIKGYLQTLLVHNRNPLRFIEEYGIHALIFQLIIGARISFIFINPILWLVTISYFALNSLVGPTIESFYPPIVLYIAVISLILGNFMYAYNYMIGCAKRKQWNLIKFVYFVPLYWLLTSMSAVIAVYQLIFNPHYWEKTIHGLDLKKRKAINFAPAVSSYELPFTQKVKYKVEELISRRQYLAKITMPCILVSFTFFLNYTLNIYSNENLFLKRFDGLQAFTSFHFPDLMPLGIFFTSIFVFYLSRNNLWIISRFFKDLHDLIYTPIKDYRKAKASSSHLKILIFNWRNTHHKWAGGAEVFIQELAQRWVRNGNLVTIFCGNDKDSQTRETINGVDIIKRGGFYLVYFWAFLYYIFKFRGNYDVIIDCENGIPFFTPLYCAKPIFLLIHHVHQEVFRKSLPPTLASIATFLETKLMPFVYKNIQIITVSPSSKSEILKYKFTDTDPIVVFNGVDLNKYKPGKKSTHPLVLYLGRLQFYKSLHVLIKAAKKILKKVANAEFIIAGEGEQKNFLMKLSKNLNISEKIRFLARVPEEEKVKLFQKAWVFVNPSLMEGWGLTTIEANACGTPAVASNVPGLCDSVKNPHTGFLVPYGKDNKFAESILKIIKEKSLRKRLSLEAIKWAEKFTWDKSADQLYSVIFSRVRENKIRAIERKRAFSYLLAKITGLSNYEK